MLNKLLELSTLLREVPATATVAVAFANTQGATQDVLVITKLNGTVELELAPPHSRAALCYLFPVLEDRLEALPDVDGVHTWTVRFARPQLGNVVYARSRETCARLAGII